MIPKPSRIRLAHILLLLGFVAALGAGGWYAFARGKSGSGTASPRNEDTKPPQAIVAEVQHPKVGGIQRVVVQPGSVEPFEAADLYAKTSGYLVEQSVERAGKKEPVDIGTLVKAGDILARISVPEYEKQVQRDTARVKAANAKVEQMKAHKTAAEADARAADAAVVLARVLVRARTAFRQYREKQLKRVKELVVKEAVDERLRDEQEDYYLSALENENAAQEQVNASKEKAAAAAAKILQAQADLDEAVAEVGVAEADLAKSQVWLDYTVIKSPYTGVVTKRNFHPGKEGRPGAFIRAEDQGGIVPLLAVERTDVMRVVVQVPDRDVPYVSTKATAAVEIDALPGVVFDTNGKEKLTVSRWAKSEDPVTRTMRVEIDVQNPTNADHPDGILKHGMYGRVTLTLNAGTPNAVRVPSVALVGKADDGRGFVRVVRDGKVHVVAVRYAVDNGLDAEIVSGLTTADQVIVRTTGTVEEGTAVTVDGSN